MSETTHTPGPWKAEADSCAKCRVDGTCEYIIDAPPMGLHGQFKNAADAHLVAAAPEMYAVLDAFLDNFNHELDDDQCEVYDKAMAVLAKARGES